MDAFGSGEVCRRFRAAGSAATAGPEAEASGGDEAASGARVCGGRVRATESARAAEEAAGSVAAAHACSTCTHASASRRLWASMKRQYEFGPSHGSQLDYATWAKQP